MTFCALLLVGIVMMMVWLAFGVLFCCRCMVEKWTKWEVKRNFTKNDVFVNFGRILVLFAEK